MRKVWYKKNKESNPERAEFIMQKGYNTAIKMEVFLPKLLVSYRTIPVTRRLENPSALMGRQIRAPLMMSYSTNEKSVVQKEQRIQSRKGRIYHAKRLQYSHKNGSFSTKAACKLSHNTSHQKTRKPISFNGKAN